MFKRLALTWLPGASAILLLLRSPFVSVMIALCSIFSSGTVYGQPVRCIDLIEDMLAAPCWDMVRVIEDNPACEIAILSSHPTEPLRVDLGRIRWLQPFVQDRWLQPRYQHLSLRFSDPDGDHVVADLEGVEAIRWPAPNTTLFEILPGESGPATLWLRDGVNSVPFPMVIKPVFYDVMSYQDLLVSQMAVVTVAVE